MKGIHTVYSGPLFEPLPLSPMSCGAVADILDSVVSDYHVGFIWVVTLKVILYTEGL